MCPELPMQAAGSASPMEPAPTAEVLLSFTPQTTMVPGRRPSSCGRVR